MTPQQNYVRHITRRHFFAQGSHAVGWAALASLLGQSGGARGAFAANQSAATPGPHFAPKAKRVIYLHMVGGPPQMDLYDYKPVRRSGFPIFRRKFPGLCVS